MGGWWDWIGLVWSTHICMGWSGNETNRPWNGNETNRPWNGNESSVIDQVNGNQASRMEWESGQKV